VGNPARDRGRRPGRRRPRDDLLALPAPRREPGLPGRTAPPCPPPDEAAPSRPARALHETNRARLSRTTGVVSTRPRLLSAIDFVGRLRARKPPEIGGFAQEDAPLGPPAVLKTAFRPRSIREARLTPRVLASSSERARRSRSTLTEMTLTPAPLRGRPGLRRAFSQARRSAGLNGRDLVTIISRSNSFVASCSSSSSSEAFFDTKRVRSGAKARTGLRAGHCDRPGASIERPIGVLLVGGAAFSYEGPGCGGSLHRSAISSSSS
jgi:hypothetical protein